MKRIKYDLDIKGLRRTMKVTVETDCDVKASIQQDVADVYEALGICIKALVGVGYHPKSIEDAIVEKADEIRREDDKT